MDSVVGSLACVGDQDVLRKSKYPYSGIATKAAWTFNQSRISR